MSENKSCGIQDFSQYDEMSTEDLEKILRLDAENDDGKESDTETLLYVMGVLTERRKQNGQTRNTAQEAYESFKQHYMPEIDNKNFVPAKTNKERNRKLRWVRSLTATAAVLVILMLGSVTAKAFGIDVWKAVVQWTQETFHFGDGSNLGDEPNEGSELHYASLQEALNSHKVSIPLAPAYIPDGYELADIRVEQNPQQKQYRAKYINGERELLITIRDHLDSIPVYVEQSEGLVEEYEVSGVTYYLFSDIDIVKAVWINGSYECRIAGDLTIEELKLMIDSIEKG